MARITEVPISDIKRDPDNPNLGTEAGRTLLRYSLHTKGYLEPGVLDKNNTLLNGNQRTDAAEAEGIERAYIIELDPGEDPHDLAVYFKRADLDIATPEGIEAKILLNRAPQKNINFDVAALSRYADHGIDLSSLGFSDRERLKMGISGARRVPFPVESAMTDGDGSEASPITVSVNAADLWRVGNAYLYCGDCRAPTSLPLLASQIPDIRIAGAVTSPPYALQKSKQYGGVPDTEYVEWFEAVSSNLYTVLAPDAHFLLNIKPHSDDYRRSLYVFDLVTALVRRWHWHFIDEFCWRHGGIPGDPVKMGKFKNQFEPIYWFAKSISPTSPPYPFYPDQVMVESDSVILDDRYESGVTDEYQGVKTTFAARTVGHGMAYPGNIVTGRNTELLGHEAAFPVDLPAFFIQAFSKEGEAWIDPFGGSGTTAVAALNLDRYALLTEVQPKYVELALARLARAFGLTPELVGNFPG